MNDLTSEKVPGGGDDTSAAIDTTDLEQLRDLILRPLQGEVDQILQQLSDPQQQASKLSRVLPAAIRLRCAKDNKLAHSLAPVVAEAIQSSVKRNKKLLAEAIFPVIGPAVRRSIFSALQAMMQSFNQLLDHSFSVRGFKWRIEAFRTGKTFAEVVMLHTLVYQVEQVFLLHRPSGLLLQHVAAGTISAQDPDLVSGMLTAVQDFVNESFGTRDGSTLESLRVGDRLILVQERSGVVLAAVIRGEPPLDLKSVLQDVIDEIQILYRDALHDFAGDTTPFVPLQPLLEDCLHQKFKPQNKKLSPLFWMMILAAACLLGGGIFQLWHRHQNWQSYLTHLSAEPGIVVTAAGGFSNKYSLSGLRDPLAIDPVELARTYGLPVEKLRFNFETFYTIEPGILSRRLVKWLNPPETVQLDLQNGILTVTGTARHDWIETLRQTGQILPGIERVQTEQLIDADQQQFEAFKKDIEQTKLLFDSGQSELAQAEMPTLEKVADRIDRLLQLQYPLNRQVFIDIVGHADPKGTETFNLQLSRKRAGHVFRLLVRYGTPAQVLRPVGQGSVASNRQIVAPQQDHLHRRVNLSVIVIGSDY